MNFFCKIQVKQIQNKWNVPLTRFPNKHLTFFKYRTHHIIDFLISSFCQRQKTYIQKDSMAKVYKHNIIGLNVPFQDELLENKSLLEVSHCVFESVK